MDVAGTKEFEDATEEQKELWRCYVMDILPCTYGRGGKNFWKKYVARASRCEKVDLVSMIDTSDHAIALVAIETKRKEVVKNCEKRSERGVTSTKNHKPITMEGYAEHFANVRVRVPSIKESWSDAFFDWATDKYRDTNARSSSSGGDSSSTDEEQHSVPLILKTQAHLEIS